jgi:hypothetical protein
MVPPLPGYLCVAKTTQECRVLWVVSVNNHTCRTDAAYPCPAFGTRVQRIRTGMFTINIPGLLYYILITNILSHY